MHTNKTQESLANVIQQLSYPHKPDPCPLPSYPIEALEYLSRAINSHFTMGELASALHSLKNTATGIDGTTYAMQKESRAILLKLREQITTPSLTPIQPRRHHFHQTGANTNPHDTTFHPLPPRTFRPASMPTM